MNIEEEALMWTNHGQLLAVYIYGIVIEIVTSMIQFLFSDVVFIRR